MCNLKMKSEENTYSSDTLKREGANCCSILKLFVLGCANIFFYDSMILWFLDDLVFLSLLQKRGIVAAEICMSM